MIPFFEYTIMLSPIGKHIWLIDLVASRSGISYEEINEEWMRCTHNSTHGRLPRRTFNNWKKCIQEEFGVKFRCNRVTNLYYVDHLEDLKHGYAREWILNAFTVSNMLSERDALNGRILLENIPSGQTCLKPIVDAMKDNNQVSFLYQKFVTGDTQSVTLEPYCLKLYERRWYVLGHNIEKKAMRTYALDRISHIKRLVTHFQMPKDFDAEEYFADCFGVIHADDVPPEQIRLRVARSQRDYLRTLPMHPSQCETDTTEDYSEFTLFVRPTFDFIQHILSLREFTEIIEPISLRDKLAKITEQMSKVYEIKYNL